MKLSIEIDCTPEEARSFLGLPDVGPLNERLVGELQQRVSAGLAALAPEDLLKNWLSLGTGAQDQLRKFVGVMADIARRPGATGGAPGSPGSGTAPTGPTD
jgi:hypothetical protein